ncbi:MAG: PIN domain-containing protein [Candidatus Aenigmatarchaeota archaeon]
MLLVVDANIVLSSMMAGKITDLLLSPKLDVVAPELLFVEIEKHKDEIKNKSRLSPDEVETLLSLLKKKIRIFPMEEFVSFMSKSIEILGEHRKDAPYLALALKLSCPVWSYEKLFKDVGSVKSLTTSEVADLFKS